MENKLTPELIEKTKQAKSAEELIALAKENEIELSEDDAKAYLEQLNKSGELSDDELDNVAGGGCYTDDGQLVITPVYSCKRFKSGENIDLPHQCFFCMYCGTSGVRMVCMHKDNGKR